MLEPDALSQVADAIAADPGVQMLYSDEDTSTTVERIASHLKPDLVAGDDLYERVAPRHLAVYEPVLLLELVGSVDFFDGSQD